MLELTARHADAWNLAWFGEPDDRLAGGRADLAAACAAVGRDPATLAITVGVTVRFQDLIEVPPPAGSTPDKAMTGTAAEVAAGLRAHEALGADHLIVALEPTTPVAVDRLAEAVRIARATPVVPTPAEPAPAGSATAGSAPVSG